MASTQFLVLAIFAVVAISNAASSAKVNSRRLSSARETYLPDTKKHPFVCAVYIKGCSACIGTIIGDRWILLSARCAGMVQQKEHVKILCGVSDLSHPPKETQSRGIVNLFIKDNTTTDSCNPNNVALFLTDYPFNFRKATVQKANLPDKYAGATIEDSYNVPYWEYYVCPNDYPIFHPLVELYAKRVEPSRCRPKGHDECYEAAVCIESIEDYVGPLMGPLAKTDEYYKKDHTVHAISMDLDLVSDDGYTPDKYHDAQAPLNYENLEWIDTIMNPEPEPIG